ncbi:ankyrin repeat-containing protein [Neofusicoccum parvum]|uniref:Ankyrin repeat-containing protein n=1 Tax=Neofusicoccum parvum TaxID=310453 RepID=A0ACB5RZ93_9PEZI|nr:ankyrin repeat-containing protein [Neofusicoccum parvum]
MGSRGIPGLLREAWKVPASTQVTVHSLATNPSQPETKVATISFSEMPGFLQAKLNEWTSEANGKKKLTLDTHFNGFTPLHADPDSDCLMDCIAISGLGGHASGSFKSKGQPFMWLRDALPRDLPQARIFICGLDVDSVNSKSWGNITDLGTEFRDMINQLRPSKIGPPRPLVLIGHSLGGLIVKEAVINMHRFKTKDDQMNLQSLRAGLFFGVPNLGMDVQSLIPMVQGNANEYLVNTLKPGSEILSWQKGAFETASQKVLKYWYYETKESPTAQKVGSKWAMTGPRALLVEPNSATNGRPSSSEPDGHFVQPINHTHSEMVKFPHQNDQDYLRVCDHLKSIKRGIPRR